jgi:Pup amidohydrolase
VPPRPRLLGLETEYALRFTPAAGSPRPGNDVLYRALASAIGEIVQTQPGERHGAESDRFFTESGASFCYEALPYARDAGLIEAGTPECDGPSRLLCHQKAIDALLVQAIPASEQRLALDGYPGELGLLKNCRDAEGHIYGAQENYEASVATGAGLVLYRVTLALSAPIVLAHVLFFWAVVILLLVSVLLAALLAPFLSPLVPRRLKSGAQGRLFDEDNPLLVRAIERIAAPFDRALLFSVVTFAGPALRFFAFRRQRRAMIGFLVSRPILTGAGTIDQDSRFGLSEKGPAIRRVVRTAASPENRPLFDTGNLLKDLLAPLKMAFVPFFRLFRARQRMQLGLSDSNVAQVAEYLKIGTTALVLDLAEAGLLDDAPRPARPVDALHTIAADPTLGARVPIVGGSPMSAIAIQREYLRRAKAYLRASATPSMETHQIVTLWEQTLDSLEADPGRLVGSLDWVSKRYLLESCAGAAPYEVQKKIDLRYHELGTGYLARMEGAGLARKIVADAEITEAIRTPPQSTPARLRGHLIRSLASSVAPIRVSWETVRIGGRLGGKVIRLRD